MFYPTIYYEGTTIAIHSFQALISQTLGVIIAINCYILLTIFIFPNKVHHISYR